MRSEVTAVGELSELAKAILAGVPGGKLPTETDKDGIPVGAVKEGETK